MSDIPEKGAPFGLRQLEWNVKHYFHGQNQDKMLREMDTL